MKHTSTPITNIPIEFINIQPLNPLISSCEVKIMYAGKNRNGTYMSKPVANVMANSLPNIPIVGEYLEQIEDFNDHGQQMIIDSKGVHFERKTKPYGVVPADTKVWWQTFQDDDGVQREYLMCQGYLWTGRYPEAMRVIEEGNGHSMELDPDSVQGKWATFDNEEDEYFIVDEAIFSALCILGEEVEPCFEGAAIGAPNMIYSLDKDQFKSEMTLFMLDLKNALNTSKGGEQMEDNKNLDGQGTEFTSTENSNDYEGKVCPDCGEPLTADHVCDPEKKKKTMMTAEEEDKEPETDNSTTTEEEEKEPETDSAAKTDEEEKEDNSEEEKKEPEKKYDLAEVVEYTELLAKYEALEQEVFSLRDLKDSIDTEKKEKLIDTFYMLDDEDKKDVKENIKNYSLDEIEAKLSVIAVRKKVNFNLEDNDKTDNKTEEPIVSFNATQTEDSIPAWLKTVEEYKQKNNRY